MTSAAPGRVSDGGGIRVRSLNKRYGERVAVADFSIEVPSGATVGVMGPNGSGKSTVIGILGGLIHPSSGEVAIDGHELGSSALLGRVGVLPDGTPFPDDVSVGAFLTYLAGLQRLVKPERAADEALRLVGESDWKPLRFRELSFGMRRRVGIAQAFMGMPRVVLLYEPTEGLDADAIEATYQLIAHCANRRGTCLIASHDRRVLDRGCDEIVTMDRGDRARSSEAAAVGRAPSGQASARATPEAG